LKSIVILEIGEIKKESVKSKKIKIGEIKQKSVKSRK